MKGTVAIRRLLPGDDPGPVLDFLELAALEMDYAHRGLRFDRETVREWLGRFDVCHTLLATRHGELVGVASVVIGPSPLRASDRVATELAWHAHPRLSRYLRFLVMVRLLAGMRLIAQAQRVLLRINAPCGGGRGLRRLLRRMGGIPEHVTYSLTYGT